MAETASSEISEGPVLNLINKRIRNLRKKFNRILQLEETVAQGKPINKEQEDVLRSKSVVSAAIDELEKLRQPLQSAIQEELGLAFQNHQISPPAPAVETDEKPIEYKADKEEVLTDVVEDLLCLLYFGSLFDVKTQSDFTSTMLTRTHERGCCLTYDTVTDDATDLLGERDLDMISMLGGLLISRSVDSSLSHKNALVQCIERARMWLTNSDHPVESNTSITFSALREKLRKIMASDYFTTTPEIKAPLDVAAAAAAGTYASFQIPADGPMDDQSAKFQEQEAGDTQSHRVQDEVEIHNPVVDDVVPQEQVNMQEEADHNQRDFEPKDQQFNHRRNHQNQRGSRGSGRRGYANGRGGRTGGRGAGGYQIGRNQYYEQPVNYYPRNHYNNRGRGGRGGGQYYNSHQDSEAQGSHAPADVGVSV